MKTKVIYSMKNKLFRAISYILKFCSINFRAFGLKALPYVIIFVVGLLLYLDAGVFSPGYWNWGDTISPFSSEKSLTENFYLWNMFVGTGISLGYSGALPYYFFIFILNHLGVPLEPISKIVYILPTAMAGWFMYMLAGYFIEGKHKNISCLVAALFYMLMVQPWMNPKFTLGLAAMPLVLVLFIKGMNSKKNGLLFACLFAFGWLMLATTPHLLPLTVILILSYFLFCTMLNKWHISSQVKSFLIPAIILSFSLSVFWILPQLYNHFAYNLSPQLYTSPGVAMGTLKFTQPYLSLGWIFRLMYGLMSKQAPYYAMPIAIMAGFFIAIYAYSALIFHNKRAESCYLAIMGLFFTAFATGIHYPVFSSIYLWLWDHVPYFQAFRNPFYFVYPLKLIYACLIGLTTHGILKSCETKIAQHKSRKIVKLITVLVILCVISIQTFPYFQGTKYSIYGSSMVVPGDYYSLQDYLANNSEPGDRLLILPKQTWYTTYTWYSSTDLPDVAASFSPIPTLGASTGQPQGITKMLFDNIDSKNPYSMSHIVNILGMLNIRYILIHNDLPWANTSELQLFFEDPEYFTDVESYSHFTLLELQPEYRTPGIYALAADSTKPVPSKIKQNMQRLVDLYYDPEQYIVACNKYWTSMSQEEQDTLIDFSERNGVSFDLGGTWVNFLLVANQWAFNGWVQLPTISGPWYLPSNSSEALSYSFTMVNPTRYTGKVNSASPFILILNQEFDTNWVAHINGEAVDSTAHFQANGYANAWYINRTGSFDVVLKYKVQEYFYIALLISGLTFVGCLCYLGSDFARKRKNKERTVDDKKRE